MRLRQIIGFFQEENHSLISVAVVAERVGGGWGLIKKGDEVIINLVIQYAY